MTFSYHSLYKSYSNFQVKTKDNDVLFNSFFLNFFVLFTSICTVY